MNILQNIVLTGLMIIGRFMVVLDFITKMIIFNSSCSFFRKLMLIIN